MKRYKLIKKNSSESKLFEYKIGEKITRKMYDDKRFYSLDGISCNRNSILCSLFEYRIDEDDRLLEIETHNQLSNKSLIIYCESFTILKEIKPIQVSDNQRILFAIICALSVFTDDDFLTFANNWINNSDRTIESALIIEKKMIAKHHGYAALEAAIHAAKCASGEDICCNCLMSASKTLMCCNWLYDFSEIEEIAKRILQLK